MSSKYDKKDAAVSLLLSQKQPYTASPITNKTIMAYYHDINRFRNTVATPEEKEKINKKFQEFTEYFTSKENNEFYVESIILENVICNKDSLSNYVGKDLLSLYCYFTNTYSKVASYQEEGIKRIRKEFKELINKDTFKGIYDLRFPTEIKRCLVDAVNGEYVLTDEEFYQVESLYENGSNEIKSLLNKLFINVYGIGQSNNLQREELAKEFRRLYYYITDELFEAQLGRKVNIADMYLITNIQPQDFHNVSNVGLSIDEIKTLLCWFKTEFSNRANKEMLSQCSFNTGTNLEQIIKKMGNPSVSVIQEFNCGEFGKYNVKYYSKQDLDRTNEVLLDLNENYGLKIDPYTYLCVLDSVVWGEENTYYKLANTFKPILDKNTHVVKNENPILTRRIKNEG